MSAEDLVCWKCGTALGDLPMPLSRTEECRVCRADLHVCRMCEFYDTRVAKQCREPIAEEVKDKERANFCDYFKPRPGAFVAAGDETEVKQAQAELEKMFGVAPHTPGAGAPEPAPGQTREEVEAKAQLEALFGLAGEDAGAEKKPKKTAGGGTRKTTGTRKKTAKKGSKKGHR